MNVNAAKYFAQKALMYESWGSSEDAKWAARGFPEEAKWHARQMRVALGINSANQQTDIVGLSPFKGGDYCPYCGTNLTRRDNFAYECHGECYFT